MDVQKWLEKNIIFECLSGSHAYGLNNAQSDEDFRGVCIAPVDYYLGMYKFEQFETKEPDRTIFNINKFFKLASDCNPNIVEFLFVSDDVVIKTSPLWEEIKASRDDFMSKKAKFTYNGYAFAQLKRILTHRKWLLDPPKAAPLRANFGLPEQERLSPELIGAVDHVIRNVIQDELVSSFSDTVEQIDKDYIVNLFKYDIKEALHEAFSDFVIPEIVHKLTLNLDLSLEVGHKYFTDEVMDAYNKEKRYRSAANHWKQYQTWLAQRNPKRAELEAKFGYDTKHASHIFRLLIQGEEILKTGQLTVKLAPEHKELCLGVKNGAFAYDQVIEMANSRMSILDSLYDSSPLKRFPDIEKLNKLLVYLIEEFHKLTKAP